MVVARRAGAFFSTAFVAGAFLAGGFVAGAFRARVGAAVADVAFFRATRAVVSVGFSPGLLAAVAPAARFVAVATFLAAAVRFIGALLARWPSWPALRPPSSLLRESAWGQWLPRAPAVKRRGR